MRKVSHSGPEGVRRAPSRALLRDWGSRLQKVSGATVALVITGTVGRVITLLTQVVIAREFGASLSADAYFAVENVPELFVSFVAMGFSTAFIPRFAAYRVHQGEEEAWRFASSFLSLATLLSVVFAVATGGLAPLWIGVIAPGFQGPARQMAMTLLQILAPSIALLGLNAGLLGLLQSNKEFVIPELGRLSYNTVLLMVALMLSSRWGVRVLALGIDLAAVVWLAVQLVGAVRRGVLRLSWTLFHPGMKRTAAQLLPFLIAISGVELTLMLDRIVASGLAQGSISALTYAGRIILLPVGVFAIPLRTALYPTWSELAVQDQLQELVESTLEGLRVLFFVVVPACVGLVVLRTWLIRLFFERGAFDRAATLAASEALVLYAAGVPAIAAIFFLNGVYFSLGKAVTLVKVDVALWIVNLSLNLLLSRTMGHRGIALATTLSAILTAVLMVFVLRRGQLGALRVRSLLHSLCTTLATSAVMGLALVLMSAMWRHGLGPAQWGDLFVKVVVLIVTGAVTYLAAAAVFRSDELHRVIAIFRALLRGDASERVTSISGSG